VKTQRDLFVPLDPDIQLSVKEILRQHPRLVGIGSGRSAADPFVIALADARSGVVVSEETRTGNLGRPRIPDVCDAMGVRCITLIQYIAEQGWIFR
jgi:hypothetical protein